MPFKFLEHTADVKIEVNAENIEEAFKDCFYALKNSIFEDEVKEKISKEIKIGGDDLKSLLYNFLEEFLYLLDAEDFLLSKIKSIKVDKENLELIAEVLGDSASDYDFTNEVKAITYSEMLFEKKEDNYKIQFVLDV